MEPKTVADKSMPEMEDLDDESKISLYKKLGRLEGKTYLKFAIFAALLGVVILAIIFGSFTAMIAFGFLRWMEDNPVAGAFIFIGIYFLATVLFVPGLILTVGAGFVFAQVVGQGPGVAVASVVVWVGAALGATAAFIIGRFVLREQITEYAKKFEKFGLIDEVVKINGLKVTFLLRLAPVIPFNAFNYFMGLTSVTLRDYCVAHVGMIPGTIVYCFLGSTLSAVSDAGGAGFTSNPVVLIVFVVTLIIAFVGIIYIGFVAKREFNKLAEQITKDMDEMDQMMDEHRRESEIIPLKPPADESVDDIERQPFKPLKADHSLEEPEAGAPAGSHDDAEDTPQEPSEIVSHDVEEDAPAQVNNGDENQDPLDDM